MNSPHNTTHMGIEGGVDSLEKLIGVIADHGSEPPGSFDATAIDLTAVLMGTREITRRQLTGHDKSSVGTGIAATGLATTTTEARNADTATIHELAVYVVRRLSFSSTHTVIMFDDIHRVSPAKGMTQARRDAGRGAPAVLYTHFDGTEEVRLSSFYVEVITVRQNRAAFARYIKEHLSHELVARVDPGVEFTVDLFVSSGFCVRVTGTGGCRAVKVEHEPALLTLFPYGEGDGGLLGAIMMFAELLMRAIDWGRSTKARRVADDDTATSSVRRYRVLYDWCDTDFLVYLGMQHALAPDVMEKYEFIQTRAKTAKHGVRWMNATDVVHRMSRLFSPRAWGTKGDHEDRTSWISRDTTETHCTGAGVGVAILSVSTSVTPSTRDTPSSGHCLKLLSIPDTGTPRIQSLSILAALGIVCSRGCDFVHKAKVSEIMKIEDQKRTISETGILPFDMTGGVVCVNPAWVRMQPSTRVAGCSLLATAFFLDTAAKVSVSGALPADHTMYRCFGTTTTQHADIVERSMCAPSGFPAWCYL